MKTTHYRIYLILLLFCIAGLIHAQDSPQNDEALLGTWILEDASIEKIEKKRSLKIESEQVKDDAFLFICESLEFYDNKLKVLWSDNYLDGEVNIADGVLSYSSFPVPVTFHYEINQDTLSLKGEIHPESTSDTKISILLTYKKEAKQ